MHAKGHLCVYIYPINESSICRTQIDMHANTFTDKYKHDKKYTYTHKPAPYINTNTGIFTHINTHRGTCTYMNTHRQLHT